MPPAVPGKRPEFKVVLLGEVGVGKTSLFLRLKHDYFDGNVNNTVQIDSCSKIVKLDDGQEVTFQIWDTAGIERFRTMTRNYYRNAHVALLMFSIEEKSTMHYLPKWVDDVDEYSPQAIKVLVGNKWDLAPAVEEESLRDFMDVYSCNCCFSISVKTGQGIEQALKSIAKKLIAAEKRNQQRPSIFQNSVDLDTNEKSKNTTKTSCC